MSLVAPLNSILMQTGDLAPNLVATLQNNDGSTFNLTGCSVNFQLSQGGTVLFTKPATITNAAAGIVQYDWGSGDTNYVGACTGLFIVTLPGGALQTFPTVGELLITFISEVTPAATNYCSVQDVQRELQNYTFTGQTNPSVQDVATYIVESDNFINGFCGHDWLLHTITNEFYDGYAAGPRAGLILLKQLPALSVQSVSWYDGSKWQMAGQGKPLDVAPLQAYEFYPNQGKIQFYYLAIDGMNEFKVSYTAGYTTVPSNITRLSALLTALKVIAVWTQGTLESYMLGDLRVVYPKDGKYGVLWIKLTNEANRLMWQLSTRRIQVGFG